MPDLPQLSRDHVDAPRTGGDEATLAWLHDEFPGWSFGLDATATWEGALRPLWIARRPGHHPQAELTAAKLHTRLTEYLDRAERRASFGN